MAAGESGTAFADDRVEATQVGRIQSEALGCELLTAATPDSIEGRIAIMRRYDLTGSFDDFLAIWRQIVPVREKYGYRCLFAVSDREQMRFTWAFDFDGDFADFPDSQRDYYRDPDRVRLREVFHYMADYSIHPAGQLLV